MSVTLPGIRFTAESPVVDDFLPRMDIAAFVGFASTGPVNTPVSIEDEHQFLSIFGPDLQLLWDSEKGRMQSAHLGPAVRGFFQAGGQRCWVVRVADKPETQWFQIPGMAGVEFSQSKDDSAPKVTYSPIPTHINARSPGSWADHIQIGTLLNRESLGLSKSNISLTDDGMNYQINIANNLERPLQPQDLLQIHCQPTQPTVSPPSDQFTCYFPVQTVLPHANDESATILAKHLICLRKQTDGSPPSQIRLLRKTLSPKELVWDWQELNEYVSPPRKTNPFQMNYNHNPDFVLPQKGHVIPAKWETISGQGKAVLGFFLVKDVFTENNSGKTEITIIMQDENIWELIDPATLMSCNLHYPYVERVSFSIMGESPAQKGGTLSNLGLLYNSNHSWLRLESDDNFFRAPDEVNNEGPRNIDLNMEARQNNCAFAATDIYPTVKQEVNKNEELSSSYIFFPLGMNDHLFHTDFTHAGGDTNPETAIIRDGLTNEKGLDKLFFNDRLAQASPTTLESQVIHYRYVQNRKQTKPLKGIHSLYFIDEITLMSAPDAVHRGWSRCLPITDSPPAEALSEELFPPPVLSQPKDNETIKLTGNWNDIAISDTAFIFQHASDPQFQNIVQSYKIRNPNIDLPYPEGCEPHHYYRLRALSENRTSPWSNTVHFNAQNDFFGCRDSILDIIFKDAPSVAIEEQTGTNLCHLKWKLFHRKVEYQVEESFDPLFHSGRISNAGGKTQYKITPHSIDIKYYRIRATYTEDDNRVSIFSPWSNTVRLLPIQKGSEWRIHAVGDYRRDSMLNIHAAMLRMARSRGDMVSILSFPEHFQTQQAIDYKHRLIAYLGDGDNKLSSYGALYHPWLMDLQHNAKLQAFPPDGVACGVIAKQSIHRGAWVAPANIILREVMALTQIFNRDDKLQLFGEQINMLTADSRGYVVFNANTLCPDNDLIFLNVRRLLILLRRLALKEGMEATFGPNNETTQRLIERIFERPLTELYTRGAFSGDTPDKAFRVIVNESDNTMQSVDQGRLNIDLKIAPSRPLEFLTVRLIQGPDEITQAVEI